MDNRWTDGRMDGWMEEDGWMDGWRQIDRHIDMCGYMYGKIYRSVVFRCYDILWYKLKNIISFHVP